MLARSRLPPGRSARRPYHAGTLLPTGSLARASMWACAVAVALFGGVAEDGSLTVGTEAHATVSVLMSLDELVDKSSFAVVAQPVESYSKWEELGGAKRIVTYTRLVLEESVFGDAGTTKNKNDVWVRTLGGKVEGIGQHVAGEAQFAVGETSLVFLSRAPDSTAIVVGMAQGHYPLVASTDDRVLRSSPDTGTLIPRKKGEPTASARDQLIGETLTAARAKILKAKKAKK